MTYQMQKSFTLSECKPTLMIASIYLNRVSAIQFAVTGVIFDSFSIYHWLFIGWVDTQFWWCGCLMMVINCAHLSSLFLFGGVAYKVFSLIEHKIMNEGHTHGLVCNQQNITLHLWTPKEAIYLRISVKWYFHFRKPTGHSDYKHSYTASKPRHTKGILIQNIFSYGCRFAIENKLV